MLHSLLVLCWVSGSALALPPARPGRASASVQAAVAAWERGPDALGAWREDRLVPGEPDGLQVVVELALGRSTDALLDCVDAELPSAWAEAWVESELFERALVQLWVPWPELETLEACPGVERIREPHRPRPKEVFSQGYDAMFQQDWHAQGATGRGVEVLVLDVGFAGYESLLGNELPSSVETWSVSTVGGSNHGTAVAEVLHDVAPGAELSLYQFSTEVEFLDAVREISDSKAQLVNGSVGFDNLWHADGTSPVTQAVDVLVSEYGIGWVAAAGNENQRYRIGQLSAEDDGTVSIDGMNPVPIATSGGWAQASLRWSEPMGQAVIDLDLWIYDESGERCEAHGQGEDHQDGDDHPYEVVACHTGGSWAQAVVVSNGHRVSGIEGYLYAYAGLDPGDATGERNLTLPGDTRHGISVGAVDLSALGEVAEYSSRGPTDDGQQRPHLVAPAGVNTSSYGGALFSGTSSATPHVTGVAALVLDADGNREPDELRDWLRSACLDIGNEGIDNASGSGFLSPNEIPWGGCHCGSRQGRPPVGGLLLALAAGLVALLPRRRMG